jgi:hypothetical protein
VPVYEVYATTVGKSAQSMWSSPVSAVITARILAEKGWDVTINAPGGKIYQRAQFKELVDGAQK